MSEENEDEIVAVELPRWKIKKLDKIIEDRQAYDVITNKLKAWWVWAVVAGAVSIYVLYEKIFKVI